MDEDVNPIALAESRLLQDSFPRDYAATQARHAIDLRAALSDDEALWAFAMLPVGQLVSKFLPFLALLVLATPACFEASPDPCRW
jgi:hypothetical protein